MDLLSTKFFLFEEILKLSTEFYFKYLIPHRRALGYTSISICFIHVCKQVRLDDSAHGAEQFFLVIVCENGVCWLLILQQALLTAPLTLLAILFRGQDCVTWALEGVGWVTARCHPRHMHALLTLHGSTAPQRSCFSSALCPSLVEMCSLELQGS